MSEQIPETMKAFIQTGPKPYEVGLRDVPVPKLEDNDVLIKVAYCSQNPTDWKHTERISPVGAIFGCDVSGTIVKLGSNIAVKDLKVGDKVACTVHGGIFPDKGGYADYAKAESDLLWKVPESIKMEEATTVACAWVAVPHAMIFSQKQEWPPAQVPGHPWYVVYGASSSVGLFAVGLGRAMGYRVIGVCGKRNWDLVKSYGAKEVVDYKDPEAAVAEIKKISGGGVNIALDAISMGDSYKIPLDSFGPSGGRMNMVTLNVPPEAWDYRKDVEVATTVMYTLFGREFNVNPRGEPVIFKIPPGSREFHVALCKHTPDLLTKYGVKPNPVKLMGGLEDIEAGWQYMKDGKVSAEKLVYKVHP